MHCHQCSGNRIPALFLSSHELLLTLRIHLVDVLRLFLKLRSVYVKVYLVYRIQNSQLLVYTIINMFALDHQILQGNQKLHEVILNRQSKMMFMLPASWHII